MMEADQCTLKMEEGSTRQELQAAGKSKQANSPLRTPKGTSPKDTFVNETYFRLQNCKQINVCYLSHYACGNLLQQQF